MWDAVYPQRDHYQGVKKWEINAFISKRLDIQYWVHHAKCINTETTTFVITCCSTEVMFNLVKFSFFVAHPSSSFCSLNLVIHLDSRRRRRILSRENTTRGGLCWQERFVLKLNMSFRCTKIIGSSSNLYKDSNEFCNWAKQQLCTCIMLFGTFLLRRCPFMSQV